MKKLYELKEKLQRELDEIARKPEMSAGDLEAVHKLTDTIKNIDKICILEESGEYSQAGAYESYGRGNSYANRGEHWLRGHYSREDGMRGGNGGGQGGGSYRSGSYRGGYSRNDGRSEMMEHLEMALDSANEQDREDIRRFIREIGNA